MEYQVRALASFKDYNVYPREIKRGEELTVSESTYKHLVQSDPDAFELSGKVIPKSNVKKKKD